MKPKKPYAPCSFCQAPGTKHSRFITIGSVPFLTRVPMCDLHWLEGSAKLLKSVQESLGEKWFWGSP